MNLIVQATGSNDHHVGRCHILCGCRCINTWGTVGHLIWTLFCLYRCISTSWGIFTIPLALARHVYLIYQLHPLGSFPYCLESRQRPSAILSVMVFLLIVRKHFYHWTGLCTMPCRARIYGFTGDCFMESNDEIDPLFPII